MSFSGVKEGRRFRYVLNQGSNILVLAVLALTILLVALRFFGLNIYTVMSGSMEPNLPVGALIYTKPVDAKTLKKGDIITFMNDETTVVTHRIDGVITETSDTGEEILKFRTKGDANNTPDGKLVHYKNVLGTPVLSLPLLGYVANFLQRPPGIYLAIVIGTFLIALIIIPIALKRKEVPLKKTSQS